MGKVITSEKIDFFNWKTLDSNEAIENRCYTNDKYASFVLIKFNQEDIKKYFPRLLVSIQDRAIQKHAGACPHV